MTTEPFMLGLPEVPADLQVTGATGNEAMNALYQFDVDAAVSADQGFARRVIETPATLWMQLDGTPVRAVHGIVGACEATGQEEAGQADLPNQHRPSAGAASDSAAPAVSSRT